MTPLREAPSSNRTTTQTAATSIRWFETAANSPIGTGAIFYETTHNNYSQVIAAAGFCVDPSTVQNYEVPTSPAYESIVSTYCGPTTNEGPFLLAYALDGSNLAYLTETVSGGAGGAGDTAITASDSIGAALDTVRKTQPTKPLSFQVDVASGSATVAASPDIVTGTGSFPKSLSYQRFYDSKGNQSFPCLNWGAGQSNGAPPTYFWKCMNPTPRRTMLGWNDNFQIDASLTNDGIRGFGEDSALDASSAIAALYTMRGSQQIPDLPELFRHDPYRCVA